MTQVAASKRNQMRQLFREAAARFLASHAGCALPVEVLWESAAAQHVAVAQHVAAAQHVADENSRASVAALRGVHIDDLMLCAAALLGDVEATRSVESAIRVAGANALRGVDRDRIDEVAQRVSIRLLVAAEGRVAKLSSFRGTAQLRTWLRVIVVREHRALVAQEARVGSEHLDACALPDPASMQFPRLDGTLATAFKERFQSAYSELSVHDRTLLRHRYGLGMGIAKMSTLHGIHRSTMARQLAQLRARLATRIKSDMRAQLRVDSSEFDSVVRGLQSHVELSLARLFDELPTDFV